MEQSPEEIRAQMFKEHLERLEREAREFEDRLERRFEDYLLALVFDNYKEHLDQRFKPLERIVYGMVGLVLVSVLTAIIGVAVGMN